MKSYDLSATKRVFMLLLTAAIQPVMKRSACAESASFIKLAVKTGLERAFVFISA